MLFDLDTNVEPRKKISVPEICFELRMYDDGNAAMKNGICDFPVRVARIQIDAVLAI